MVSESSITEPFNTIDSELITLIYRVRHLQVRDRTLSMPGLVILMLQAPTIKVS